MPAPTSSPGFSQRADVFLSYARPDLDMARALAAELVEAGLEVAFDLTHLVPGEDYAGRLDALLIASAKIVFLATPASVASPACRHELDLATRHTKPVLPVLVAGMTRADLPEPLREIQYLRREAVDMIPRLTAAIRTDLDWERRHAEYERQAARGEGEVIPHSRGVQDAQDWLGARPARASPVSEPVRDLISRSRQRLRRRNRIVMTGLVGATLAMAGLATGLYQQWREARQQTGLAEAATAIAQARARNLAIEQARTLADEGRVEEALLSLLDAAKAYDETNAPQFLRVGFDRVLQRALTETRYTLPASVTPLVLPQQMWLHDPATGTLWQVTEAGPVEAAIIPGDAQLIAEVDGIDGVVLAISTSEGLQFHAAAPGTRSRLLAEVVGWEWVAQPDASQTWRAKPIFTVNRDGFALVRTPPGNNSPAEGRGSVAFVNLRTGATRSATPGMHVALALDADGQSYAALERYDAEALAAAAGISLPAFTEYYLEDLLRACFQRDLHERDLPRALEHYLPAGGPPEQHEPPETTDPTFTFDGPEGWGLYFFLVQDGCRILDDASFLSVSQDGFTTTTRDDLSEGPPLDRQWSFSPAESLRISGVAAYSSETVDHWYTASLRDLFEHSDTYSYGTLRENDEALLYSSLIFPVWQRRMHSPILALAALSEERVAVFLEERLTAGALAGRDLVLIRRTTDPVLPIALDTARLPEPAGPTFGNGFPNALNPIIDLSTEFATLSGSSPYGTFTLHPFLEGGAEVRLTRPDGTLSLGPTIPRDLMSDGGLAIGAEAQHVAWFGDRRIRVFSRGGHQFPELLLPRAATTVRLLGQGSDLLVADGSFSAALWTYGETGWSRSTAYASDRIISAIDADTTGRWLLATISHDGFDFLNLIDRETGTLVQTLAAHPQYELWGWFWSAETVAISLYRQQAQLYRLPSLADYRRLAAEALRPLCRPMPGADWQTSPCWERSP